MDDTTTIREAKSASGDGEDHPILFVHSISRQFRQGDSALDVLKGAELAVWAGQSVALVAPSGAGKSTLLQIAGLLEQPDSGEVYIDSLATSHLSDNARTRIRRTDIGFVYQFHHLLPEFSALENVMLPQMIRGLSRSEATSRGVELLSYLGLKERLMHRPAELSGGEQQRVALARALVNKPRLLLADEPTGDLDEATASQVFELLERIHAQFGLTSIVVTHNMELAARCTRVMRLDGGRLIPTTETNTASKQI